jgi:hypothetical protein
MYNETQRNHNCTILMAGSLHQEVRPVYVVAGTAPNKDVNTGDNWRG